MSFDRIPYMRMLVREAVASDAPQRIIWQMGAQLSKTSRLVAIAAWRARWTPANMIFALDTLTSARIVGDERHKPAFQCPDLCDRVNFTRGCEAESGVLHIRFRSQTGDRATLYLCGSQMSSGLSRRESIQPIFSSSGVIIRMPG